MASSQSASVWHQAELKFMTIDRERTYLGTVFPQNLCHSAVAILHFGDTQRRFSVFVDSIRTSPGLEQDLEHLDAVAHHCCAHGTAHARSLHIRTSTHTHTHTHTYTHTHTHISVATQTIGHSASCRPGGRRAEPGAGGRMPFEDGLTMSPGC